MGWKSIGQRQRLIFKEFQFCLKCGSERDEEDEVVGEVFKEIFKGWLRFGLKDCWIIL